MIRVRSRALSLALVQSLALALTLALAQPWQPGHWLGEPGGRAGQKHWKSEDKINYSKELENTRRNIDATHTFLLFVDLEGHCGCNPHIGNYSFAVSFWNFH